MAKTLFRVSSSIDNFRVKLKAALELEEWTKPSLDNAIFFGLYHNGDYKKFLKHKGLKKVFWCGGDILALRNSPWLKKIIKEPAIHYCENEIEQWTLHGMGINAQIRPMIFDDPDKYQITYQPRERPIVFVSGRPDRGNEYGLYELQNLKDLGVQFVYFDGTYDPVLYDQEIQTYQACLRLNDFDGFSEAVAKSVLMGQYPITKIKYPMIDCGAFSDDLAELLTKLKDKTEPNYEASNYWRKTLKENKEEVVNNW